MKALGSVFIIAMSSMALAACSTGTDSQTPVGAGGATDASSAGGASGSSAGGLGGTSAGLFGDPTVPTCKISSIAADLEVKGTVAGQPVTMQQIPTSNIASGDLQVLDSYKTDAGYQLRIDLHLQWSGSLAQGVVTKLSGGNFYVPEGQPGGGQFYCFSQGDFGPVAAAEQTGTGKLFKFRMQGLQAKADCSGGPVAGELTGCIYRLNDYLP